MPFIKFDAAQYRALDAAAFDARCNEVAAELDNTESTVPFADLNEEVGIIGQERARRKAALDLRNAAANAVANGAGTVVSRSAEPHPAPDVRVVRDEDPFDTESYIRSFAEYVTRGKVTEGLTAVRGMVPPQVRADAFTATTDVEHYIPTSIAAKIIEKMSEYGELWPEVTKMNIQGGVEINTWDWLPTAQWITETTHADFQKVVDAEPISFKYHTAECRVAQTFLASLVTLDDFQRRYPEKMAEAMVRLLDQGIVRGTGSGQMTGYLNESRIVTANKKTIAAADMGKWGTWSTILSPLTRYYRRGGTFIMAQNTWDKYIDGMVDSNGQPIARVNHGLESAHDTGYRLLGKPVKIVEDDILPSYDDALGQTADTPFMLFTRLSDYLVNQQQGMRTVRWRDEEDNKIKYKTDIVVDGRLGDPYGTMVFSAPKNAGA